MRATIPALLAVLLAATLSGAGAAAPAGVAVGSCPPPGATAAYAHKVRAALYARHDVLGRRLLAKPGGPSYDRVRDVLAPLFYAAGGGGRKLTESGAYYLPFAYPFNVNGARLFALHVADGSEIVARRVGGPSVTVYVGPNGKERYGSCLRRLDTATLANGYLPILDTSYTDVTGVKYQQESFVGRAFGTISLSYVHIHVDATSATRDTQVRLVPTPGTLAHQGNQLLSHGSTRLVWSGDAEVDHSAVTFDIPAGTEGDVYYGIPSRSTDGRPLQVGEQAYDAARTVVGNFWQKRLDAGTTFDVPDEQVGNAEQALLVQELLLTWRYSAGNSYEELSYAEAADVARVMAEYGQDDVAQTILRFALKRLPQRYTNWRAGSLLVAHADLYRLSRNRTFLNRETPRLAQLVQAIGRQVDESKTGLLPPEAYSSDIARSVYALHGQATVWQGLVSLGRVWSITGHPQLAARSRKVAARLRHGLLHAITRSARRLHDGSVFVPAALLDGQRPFPNLALSRQGTYWNLVMPYALASGLLPAHGRIAHGMLRYLLGHGGRLLGLVRAGAGRLYGQYPPRPTSGIDQVYGVNVARFLADADQPDQLDLSLYGMLGAAMTPNTFVAGESASVTPLHGRLYRTMYQPPNGGANAAFLENLRLLLVHETRGPADAPRGLELAFATPRAWLTDGQTIEVDRAPTSFGPVSFTLTRDGSTISGTLVLPRSPRPATVRLRLRLPSGQHLRAVRVNGRPVRAGRAGTIDLSRRTGHVTLRAVVG